MEEDEQREIVSIREVAKKIEKQKRQKRRRKRKRRKEEERIHRKKEFKKTRMFMSDRIRICKLKRLGRRQCFEFSKRILSGVIKILHETKTEEMRVKRHICLTERIRTLQSKRKTEERQRERKKLRVLWRKAYEEGVREGTDADSKCKDISMRYLKVVSDRTRKKEAQRIQVMGTHFHKRQEVLIKKVRYTRYKKQGIINIICNRVSKTKICRSILVSLEAEQRKGTGLMSGGRGGERGRDKSMSKRGNKLKVRVKGARHYGVRDNGQIWVLPQKVEEVLNWRRD